MLKIYIGKLISDLPLILDYANTSSLMVEYVDSKEEADYLLIPHNWPHVFNRPDFLADYICKTKQTIIFCFGDSATKINFPRAVVFRTSGYKRDLAKNEIIMPTVVEDLGARFGVTMRVKRDKSDRPTVGFVGWAKQGGWAHYKTLFKNIFLFGPYKKGLIFRRRAMQALAESTLIETDFATTDAYHKGTKEEFVQNIVNTDFTLAPKGDGNYSARFYEVLSLGRLPILIDTDVVLPLEEDIDYDEFVVRVPYDEIDQIGKIVGEFYNNMSDEQYRIEQIKAREVFMEYLAIDKYLKHVLTISFLKKYV